MSEAKSISTPTGPDQGHFFWDRYIEKLHESGVRPPFNRWFVLRAKQYLEAHRDKNVATHGPRDVDEYFRHAGRRSDLELWQFRQVVELYRNFSSWWVWIG